MQTHEHTDGHRDGETYDPGRDLARLNRQAAAVYELMQDKHWRTLAEIALATGEPEPSISARLRDLRKDRFGGFVVEREYVSHGQWRYRVLPPKPVEAVQTEMAFA